MSIAAERRAAARIHCARALRCRRGWYLTVSASHRRRRRGARVAQVQFITDNLGGDIHPGFSIWRYLEVASTEIGRPADRTYPRRIASPCSAPHRTRRNDGTTAHERRRRRPRPTGAATARPPATVRATAAASFGGKVLNESFIIVNESNAGSFALNRHLRQPVGHKHRAASRFKDT